MKALFRAQLSELFDVVEYSLWKAIIAKYVTVVCTYMWTFMDMFIMIISVGLSNRFQILNDDLSRIKGKHMNEQFWSTRRNQYHNLCRFVVFIDKNMSHVIIISFTNNLFFVCVQLLRSLR